MAIDEHKKNLIIEHFKKLKNKFIGLELINAEDESFMVSGNLSFSHSHDGKTIEDDYDVEIVIPNDYPQNPPAVKETSNKIPRNKDNHVNPEDGTLCLGAPLAVKRKFAQQRNLLWFVIEQVISFLFLYSYKRDYGSSPFGELSHGARGLLEYYKELFSVHDNLQVLGLLKILADNNYRGHALCPCGSTKKVRFCHGALLLEIRDYQSPSSYMNEHLIILKLLIKDNKNKDLGKYVPKEFANNKKKKNRKLISKKL